MPSTSPSRLMSSTNRARLRRVAAILAGIVLGYGVIGFFILPGIIRTQAEVLIAQKLGRDATIGAVEFNPYTLTLTLRDVKVRERKSEDVFVSFDMLHVNVSAESFLRLAPVVRELRLTAPYVHLARTGAHRYNIDDIITLISSQPSSEEPARFSFNNIQVEGGRIVFDDRPAKASHTVTELALGIPFISSLPSQVDIFIEPLLRARLNDAPFEFKGKARPFAEPKDAVLELRLDGLDLTRAVEYLPVKPQGRIPGAKLDLNLTARFQQGGEQRALLLQGDAALKALQVEDSAGKPVLRMKELAVQLKEADVFGGRIDLSRVRVDGLQADMRRGADGVFNFAKLFPPAPASPSRSKDASAPLALRIGLDELDVNGAAFNYTDEQPAQPLRASMNKFDLALRRMAVDTRKQAVDIGEIVSARAEAQVSHRPVGTRPPRTGPAEPAPAQDGTDWAVNIGKAGISNWSVRVEEQGTSEPVVTTASPLSINLQGLSTAKAARARVDMKANVNKSGQMTVNGTVGITPLHADLTLDIKEIDILPLQPFITDRFNLRATSASLSSTGKVRLDASADGKLRGGFKGDVTLGNLATVDKAGNNDFLRWKSLYAGGVDVTFEPLAVNVDQLALADFFARVIIDPSGRINLQDIVRGNPDAAPPKAENGGRASPMPPVSIKRVSLQGGRVRFTDNFIKPNYSASLSRFGGVVSGLSSDPASRAEVELRGEVNGAPLAVNGRINPLRGDLFLDVKANVRGMELAPLSAYSGKYVGYGIEKGKLSFEAGYQLDNRKLSADNRLVLEQLTFGDKVESPDATSLPVQFAVALLADRNGVIDLNLPVAGSLDDPQFSIGAIVFKLIGNAIMKAVTQPFALLGSLFGGGAELSNMAFEPGRATIPPAGEEKLRALARALTERPGLRLDIGGRADAENDREGLKHVVVERKVRALKMRDLRAKGVTVEPGSVTVSREEYPGLLLRAYRDEKFPKPRNILGLPKDLPVEEMEKLMAANADIDEDDLVSLANQRAQSVKNWLQKNGQVPPERMFITAAKLSAAGGPPARVDFALR